MDTGGVTCAMVIRTGSKSRRGGVVLHEYQQILGLLPLFEKKIVGAGSSAHVLWNPESYFGSSVRKHRCKTWDVFSAFSNGQAERRLVLHLWTNQERCASGACSDVVSTPAAPLEVPPTRPRARRAAADRGVVGDSGHGWFATVSYPEHESAQCENLPRT